MNCFMFPGQPFAAPAAWPSEADFQEVASLMRQHGGFDLVSGSWLLGDGTEQLGLQLQGMAHSLYHLRKLKSHGVVPGIVAQHSMGIYPALVACGSLGEPQAIELTRRIGGSLAGMAAGTEQYALASVIGLPLHVVESVAANHQVYLANHNTSRHFLISGLKREIEQATREALSLGAYSARGIACDAPLHSPLLSQLEDELQLTIAEYRYRDPAFPLMNHLNQTYLSAQDVPRFLLRELQLPVYWERTYRALTGSGVTSFYEVGEGESLRKFNRWIDSDIRRPVLQ